MSVLRGDAGAVTWRHWLSVGLGAFAGGAGAWAASHLDPSAFTSSRSIGAFAIGAAIAGMVGIAHLLQPAPDKS